MLKETSPEALSLVEGDEGSDDEGSEDEDDEGDSEPTVLADVYLEKMISKYFSTS